MQSVEIRSIVVEVRIEAPVERVWEAMVQPEPGWWPQDFLNLGETSKMKFEPWAGGRLYEVANDGREILWANLVMLVPGQFLEFVGYMTPTYCGPSVTMYRMEVKPTESGASLFRISDTVMGRIDDEQEANLHEGWTYLFEKGLKAHVEAPAG